MSNHNSSKIAYLEYIISVVQ